MRAIQYVGNATPWTGAWMSANNRMSFLVAANLPVGLTT
jgi:hypothetical protein